ncbi:MAG: DUF3192 domain-containing protein [Deltaproteobacteria bacterium]|nr:DUF3192 domain-containing protein [Deltaproteobacteria bacterium]
MTKGKYLLVLILFGLSGCLGIKPAINKHREVAHTIELGDSKKNVLSTLLPTQESLCDTCRKSPEKFMRDGKKVEIYFMRTGWTQDGKTSDDEFTPYVFTDGFLTGIGWENLGGPKTEGQVPNQVIINNNTPP